jgi:putative tryptophan/tyrosine transport system permease protein
MQRKGHSDLFSAFVVRKETTREVTMIQYFTSLNPAAFGNALPGNVAQGLIWGIMALGVYITFRLLDFADLTVDGSFATGGAVTVMMTITGHNIWISLLCASLAGLLAGLCTGLLHTKLGIPPILAGILTQIALYSVNLNIMDRHANQALSIDKYTLILSSRNLTKAIIVGLLFSVVLIALLYWYFGTEQGSAIRATGCNPAMSKAQGINIDNMKLIGLALSNAIVAMSGGLLSQYSGFADVNMGRGGIVIGLAAVIIGEVLGDAILGKRMDFKGRLTFVVIGGIIYYIVIGIVLWLKMPSEDLKLFTAIIVAIFLAVPYLKGQSKSSFKKAGKKAAAMAAGSKEGK